jgi:hypothetical protein
MKVQPITFSVEDIRALQASRKTILHLPLELSFAEPVQQGDLLWIREVAYISGRSFTDQASASHPEGRIIRYQANMDASSVSAAQEFGVKRTPAMKMPRFASRFTLFVDSTSVISLDQITEPEARRAGVWFDGSHYRGGRHSVRGTLNRHSNALDAFRDTWSSIYTNTDYSLHRNPRILRLRFTAIPKNVDDYLASFQISTAPAR